MFHESLKMAEGDNNSLATAKTLNGFSGSRIGMLKELDP